MAKAMGTVQATVYDKSLKLKHEYRKVTTAPGPVTFVSGLRRVDFVNLTWAESLGDVVSVLYYTLDSDGSTVNVCNTGGIVKDVSVEVIGY